MAFLFLSEINYGYFWSIIEDGVLEGGLALTLPFLLDFLGDVKAKSS